MPDDTAPIPDVHEATSALDARTHLGRRVRGMSWFVGAALLGLAARGVHLQIVHGAEHAARLEAASVKRVRLAPSRGVIRDARGRVVAEDRVAVDAYVVPDRMLARPEEKVPRLAAALGLSDDERSRLRQKLDAVPAAKRGQLLLVRRDVHPERLQAIRDDRALSWIKLVERAGRRYPFGSLGAHAIGYMNEVSPADLANDPGKRPGDRVGRTGVERAQDRALRGTPGHAFVAATHRVVVPAGREGTAPIAGHDVTLTLDMDLERALDEAFDRHDQRKGAAVLIDVHTGRVLAMTSRPAFDPNLLDRGVAVPAAGSELDRALLETAKPGSTIMPFTALAALASDRAATEHPVECKGVYPFESRLFRCTHAHGRLDLDHALAENCWVWFYDQAARLGLDAIVSEARPFGFGVPTGIEIGRELAGLVPTRAWYKRFEPGPFHAGHGLVAAIGQDNVWVTPIQLAVAYAALANGGTVRTPQIVVSDVPAPARQVDVPAADLARIRVALRARASELSGLQASVAGTRGASDSREFFLVPMTDIEAEDGPRDDEPPARPIRIPGTNGWFAGFAPADVPEVAIVVLVQGRFFSSHRAATAIADDALRAYFAGKERGSR
ncbi:penicillin-binding transpeptidase domain-containing protein [Polyangium mundeleinium]|uniref:Penicillin-binding transpeptidase domain-containing protein n=1 Tax=Polyangium mundeleinium TaxID=2995306 RepID=A0ABT5ENN5_9BACT|nr:penicillin-binding transpeptidase domain-containing protein [Polyangium mundeleinium]MDC0743064.1 penicillin-binding transpeptidase domain-containing protein [Polyangium mundeleinium]